MDKETTLSDILVGETCEFIKMDEKINTKLTTRLGALGFTPNTKIEVIRTKPNYLIKVRGIQYALGNNISKNMYVKKY